MKFKIAKCIFCKKWHIRVISFGKCFVEYLELDMKDQINLNQIIKKVDAIK